MTRKRALPLMDDHDWERLARYVTGEASGAESAATTAWINADDTRRELYERMRSAWAAQKDTEGGTAEAGAGMWDSTAAWRQIDPQLFATPPGASGQPI